MYLFCLALDFFRCKFSSLQPNKHLSLKFEFDYHTQPVSNLWRLWSKLTMHPDRFNKGEKKDVALDIIDPWKLVVTIDGGNKNLL